MKIKLSSVLVDDQDKALGFYTDKLGFIKKNDIPMGEARWLTVVSPQAPVKSNWRSNPTATRPPRRSRRRCSNRGSR